jgi:uncharacterized protein YdhG (YjbR/CyaY superfamily)
VTDEERARAFIIPGAPELARDATVERLVRLLEDVRADERERAGDLRETLERVDEDLATAREAIAYHGDIDNPDLTQEGNFVLGHVDTARHRIAEALGPQPDEKDTSAVAFR